MTKWDGKTRGGVLGYKIFIFLLNHLPLQFVYFILRFVVLYFLLFAPGAVKSQYQFLRKRLQYPLLKSLGNIYSNFFLLGQTIIDRIGVMSRNPLRFTYNFEGENHLEDMLKAGRGGILISCHIGNWEIAGQLLNRLTTKVNIVMHDAEHQKIKQLLNNVMTRKSVNIIVIKNDLSDIIQIASALRNNEFICIHADRFLPGAKTVPYKMLGKSALFPEGPFQIAMKLRVPVSFVFAMKEKSRHYHFYASKPITVEKKRSRVDQEQRIRELLGFYVTNLETMIKKYPNQWFNYFDFWS